MRKYFRMQEENITRAIIVVQVKKVNLELFIKYPLANENNNEVGCLVTKDWYFIFILFGRLY